ncbi:MAG TPA: hypothetical protein VF746_02215 [Longimicrobium sp.]
MKEDLFEELVESIKEAGAYLRGEQVPARITILPSPLAPPREDAGPCRPKPPV